VVQWCSQWTCWVLYELDRWDEYAELDKDSSKWNNHEHSQTTVMTVQYKNDIWASTHIFSGCANLGLCNVSDWHRPLRFNDSPHLWLSLHHFSLPSSGNTSMTNNFSFLSFVILLMIFLVLRTLTALRAWFLSKLTERVVKLRLTHHLSSNDLLNYF